MNIISNNRELSVALKMTIPTDGVVVEEQGTAFLIRVWWHTLILSELGVAQVNQRVYLKKKAT